MFTGIVEELGRVVDQQDATLVIGAKVALEGARLGDSIAVNGACLTVTLLGDDTFTVDLSPETNRRTNLGTIRPGDQVNLERPLAYGGRIGGHLVQGHIDGTGTVQSITQEDDTFLFAFEAPPSLMRYIVEKGFVAVDGISLTVVERHPTVFTVSVIPYTHSHTVLGSRKLVDSVNIEIDILAKYVEQLVGDQWRGGGPV